MQLFPRRPDGRNQTGFAQARKPSARPWGSLPKGCNKMRSYRSATAPGLGILFIERQQGIPVDPPDSPHSHGGQVKGCPWGWNRLSFKALLPFPGAVFGFCSPWAETPTGKVLRTFKRSYGQRV